MAVRKGECVEKLKPWKVLPLFTDDGEAAHRNFPNYQAAEDLRVGGPNTTPAGTNPRFFGYNVASKSGSKYLSQVLAFCVQLVANDEADDVLDTIVAKPLDDEGNDDEEKWRAWILVQDKIDFPSWSCLVKFIRRRLHVVATEHPRRAYASQHVPKLTDAERSSVARVLGLEAAAAGSLSLMKQIHDLYSDRLYGVLLCASDDKYAHSCVPTAQLEFLPQGGLSVTALYDLNEHEPITLCCITEAGDSVEQRENAVLRRNGHSCACMRCRYEVDPVSTGQLATFVPLRLGHCYFSQGHCDAARDLYKLALERMPDHADAWHALGAIELAKGRFLAAQRIWKQAADDYPTACASHEGIALQVEKIRSYGYLDPQSSPMSDIPLPPTVQGQRNPFPDVFITPMIDKRACTQILEWAETGEWTQQRHYAVPTFDVPVHTVRPLLEWFNHFVTSQVRQLLAHQFGTTTNYYVHDAFCVRYQASEASDHLPIHTDESTHSFVLALDEDYAGGGTNFFDFNSTIRLKAGELLSFRGDQLQHGGEAVTKGVRHILAVFLYHDNEGRHPKRHGADISVLLRRAKEQKLTFSFGFQN